jgi:hypothetical protein
MRLSVAVDMDQLHLLPIEIRLDIQRALRIELAPVQHPQPMQQTLYNQQPQQPAPVYQSVQEPSQAPPQKMLPTHVYQPPKSTGPPPRLDGNVMVYPAQMNSPMQMNSAMDIMTGQPINVPPVSQAPVIPQFNNAPVNVAPVATSGPPAVTHHPGLSTADVRSHFIRLFQDKARGGEGIAQAALAKSGLHQLAALNDGNVGALWQALGELGGR